MNKIYAEVFRFEAGRDYLPYYQKLEIRQTSPFYLSDLLKFFQTNIAGFALEQNFAPTLTSTQENLAQKSACLESDSLNNDSLVEIPAFRINGKAFFKDCTLSSVVAKFGTELICEPLSTKYALKDFSLNYDALLPRHKEFFQKFSFIEEKHATQALLPFLKYNFASAQENLKNSGNGENSENDEYLGDGFLYYVWHLCKLYKAQSHALIEYIATHKNGLLNFVRTADNAPISEVIFSLMAQYFKSKKRSLFKKPLRLPLNESRLLNNTRGANLASASVDSQIVFFDAYARGLKTPQFRALQKRAQFLLKDFKFLANPPKLRAYKGARQNLRDLECAFFDMVYNLAIIQKLNALLVFIEEDAYLWALSVEAELRESRDSLFALLAKQDIEFHQNKIQESSIALLDSLLENSTLKPSAQKGVLLSSKPANSFLLTKRADITNICAAVNFATMRDKNLAQKCFKQQLFDLENLGVDYIATSSLSWLDGLKNAQKSLPRDYAKIPIISHLELYSHAQSM